MTRNLIRMVINKYYGFSDIPRKGETQEKWEENLENVLL